LYLWSIVVCLLGLVCAHFSLSSFLPDPAVIRKVKDQHTHTCIYLTQMHILQVGYDYDNYTRRKNPQRIYDITVGLMCKQIQHVEESIVFAWHTHMNHTHMLI